MGGNQRRDTALSQFWPYIMILRFAGTRPLCVNKTFPGTGNTRIKLGFKFFSPLFFYSIVMSSASFYTFFMMTLNWMFKIYWPQKLFYEHPMLVARDYENPMGLLISKLFMLNHCSFPLTRIVVIWSQITNFRPIANHIEDMIQIYEDLQKHWENRGQEFSSTIRRNILHIILISMVMPLVSLIPLITEIFLKGQPVSPVVSNEPFMLFFLIQTTCVFVDDADLHIQCKIVSEVYHQIEMMIGDTRRFNGINLVQVRIWHQFLHRNRRLCFKIGKVTKIPQLFAILNLNVGAILFLYSVIETLNPVKDHNNHNILMATFVSLTFSVVLLYAKTLRAESVTKSEASLNQALFSLTNDMESPEVQLELKEMQSTMITAPTAITLGSYAKLNQGIFLTLSTQVVTYLIVLLQFGKAAP
ncbi:unnamed protein product [Allacma fusca]|uniref:Gustatory receptor n=1 Tax=Allacma fusca TaxID=39272 RepID=A0A8J2L3E5_9HEXA|nr:unnamed protein product [Allacma fusca]